MRLIDGDAIIIDLLDRGIEGVQTDDYAEFQHIVEDAPTVDAVPVCRCAECKHSKGACIDLWGEPAIECITGQTHSRNWFCADGKRKGGDE